MNHNRETGGKVGGYFLIKQTRFYQKKTLHSSLFILGWESESLWRKENLSLIENGSWSLSLLAPSAPRGFWFHEWAGNNHGWLDFHLFAEIYKWGHIWECLRFLKSGKSFHLLLVPLSVFYILPSWGAESMIIVKIYLCHSHS